MSKESLSEFAANNSVFLITMMISCFLLLFVLYVLKIKRKIKKSGLTAAEYYKKNPLKNHKHYQSGE
jgi:hypothetical protein